MIVTFRWNYIDREDENIYYVGKEEIECRTYKYIVDMLNEMWVEHFNIIVLLVLLKMDINIFENESSQQQVRFIDRTEKIPRADRHYPILPPLPLSDLKSNNSPNNYAKLYARALLPSLPYFITIRIR